MIAALSLILGFALAEPAIPTSTTTSTVASSIALEPQRQPSIEYRPHWPAWLGASTTILGLGLGTYYRAVAHEASVEAQRTSDMDTYKRDLGDAHTGRVLSTIFLVTAGVSLVATLLYYFWPSD